MFAKLLDEYMKNARLNDETLAAQIDVARRTVTNWRRGITRRPPSREKVLKCASILKLFPKQRMAFFQAAGILDITGLEQKLVPVVGRPIIKPYQFFGREELLRNIYWAWHKEVPESIAIIGPKRSGKTSVLNYLKNITQTVYYRPNQLKGWPTDWLPYHVQVAFVDFLEANMSQPETLMTDILQQLNLEVPSSCTLADFSRILRNVENSLVILMDNIEIGLKTTTLGNSFWRNMAALGNCEPVRFVITASELPLELARDCRKPSPFFKLFGHTLQLEAFTEEEARELLSNSPEPFSAEEIEGMLKESNCWPEPLQQSCDKQLRKLLRDKKSFL
jgi:transcriptional regulator with XRE-family HTH domain